MCELIAVARSPSTHINSFFTAQNEFEDRALTVEPCCRDLCPPTGAGVLAYYGVDDMSLAANVGVLVAFVVALRLLAYVVLRSRGAKYDKTT